MELQVQHVCFAHAVRATSARCVPPLLAEPPDHAVPPHHAVTPQHVVPLVQGASPAGILTNSIS